MEYICDGQMLRNKEQQYDGAMEFLVVHFIFKSLSGPSGAVISTYC
jgi:hypothetical protein